jgi:hypothetical protein
VNAAFQFDGRRTRWVNLSIKSVRIQVSRQKPKNRFAGRGQRRRIGGNKCDAKAIPNELPSVK